MVCTFSLKSWFIILFSKTTNYLPNFYVKNIHFFANLTKPCFNSAKQNLPSHNVCLTWSREVGGEASLFPIPCLVERHKVVSFPGRGNAALRSRVYNWCLDSSAFVNMFIVVIITVNIITIISKLSVMTFITEFSHE